MHNIEITITRVSSNKEDDYIALIVSDEASGLMILRAKMTAKHFALALTGLAVQPAEAERIISPSLCAELVKVREVKRVAVDAPHRLDKTLKRDKQMIQAAASGYAPEGWRLHDYGFSTQQPVSGKHYFTLIRFVDPEPKS